MEREPCEIRDTPPSVGRDLALLAQTVEMLDVESTIVPDVTALVEAVLASAHRSLQMKQSLPRVFMS
jgi:hypothetical protein